MDTFIVVTTVSTLRIGGVTIWQTNRSGRIAIRARYDERQAELRADLRCWINKQFRLVRAVDGVERGLPGDAVRADLDEFRDYLAAMQRHLVAPSPAQLEVVIKSIDEAVVKLEVLQGVPRRDAMFIPHVTEIKCNVLRPWLKRAQDNIKVLHDGLAEIERRPMSVRKQIKLFTALDPKRQKPIEE